MTTAPATVAAASTIIVWTPTAAAHALLHVYNARPGPRETVDWATGQLDRLHPGRPLLTADQVMDAIRQLPPWTDDGLVQVAARDWRTVPCEDPFCGCGHPRRRRFNAGFARDDYGVSDSYGGHVDPLVALLTAREREALTLPPRDRGAVGWCRAHPGRWVPDGRRTGTQPPSSLSTPRRLVHDDGSVCYEAPPCYPRSPDLT